MQGLWWLIICLYFESLIEREYRMIVSLAYSQGSVSIPENPYSSFTVFPSFYQNYQLFLLCLLHYTSHDVVATLGVVSSADWSSWPPSLSSEMLQLHHSSLFDCWLDTDWSEYGGSGDQFRFIWSVYGSWRWWGEEEKLLKIINNWNSWNNSEQVEMNRDHQTICTQTLQCC